MSHRLFISPHIRRLVELALDEDDLGFDVTSNAFFGGVDGSASLVAKQDLVVAGLAVVPEVFSMVDRRIEWTFDVADGDAIGTGDVLGRATGDAASLLRGERTALNFLQRMCGVATKTRRYVEALGDDGPRITDTRKTLPGWRELDKYAVACGGGANHRFSLAGGVMVKDNHIAAAGGIAEAVREVRRTAPHTLRVEVEVETLDMVDEALDAGAEIIMLDNMTTAKMRTAIERIRAHSGGRVVIEASGNITLERLPELAELDLDYISSGALTHSVIAADISMKMG